MGIGVTFLIGNGFDMQQGMMTSYTDFYKTNQSKEKYNGQNIFYKEIECSSDKWSDFELQFGQFTKGNMQDYTKEVFFNDLDEVMNDLAIYLKNEEENFLSKNFDLAAPTLKTLSTFYDDLSSTESETIKKQLELYSSTNFNFICFNYTSIVSKFINSIRSDNISFYEQLHVSTVQEPLQVHGTLDNHMILGVDNESQLSTTYFTKDEIDSLTKFSLITSSRDLRLSSAKKIILESSIIVIFGMALGDTDISWWKEIGSWLENNESNHLIIHNFDRHLDPVTANRNTRKVNQRRKETEDRLLCFLDIDDSIKERMRKQIFVITNSVNTFNINDK